MASRITSSITGVAPAASANTRMAESSNRVRINRRFFSAIRGRWSVVARPEGASESWLGMVISFSDKMSLLKTMQIVR
ncbi:hypothetical protein D3C80_1468640 [compost metagenome]